MNELVGTPKIAARLATSCLVRGLSLIPVTSDLIDDLGMY